jgi:hypothetical protein
MQNYRDEEIGVSILYNPHSQAVEALANQLDPLKRIRRNGGARDLLAPKGIAILFGKTDREILNQLGYLTLAGDEFVSHTPKDDRERSLLRAAGHID